VLLKHTLFRETRQAVPDASRKIFPGRPFQGHILILRIFPIFVNRCGRRFEIPDAGDGMPSISVGLPQIAAFSSIKMGGGRKAAAGRRCLSFPPFQGASVRYPRALESAPTPQTATASSGTRGSLSHPRLDLRR